MKWRLPLCCSASHVSVCRGGFGMHNACVTGQSTAELWHADGATVQPQ